MMNKIGLKISAFLEKPLRVMVFCMIFLVAGLVLDGSLWRLYQIHRNHLVLLDKIREEDSRLEKIRQQLRQLKNPAYIEKQARDRLEFLEKDDLLFVFSED